MRAIDRNLTCTTKLRQKERNQSERGVGGGGGGGRRELVYRTSIWSKQNIVKFVLQAKKTTNHKRKGKTFKKSGSWFLFIGTEWNKFEWNGKERWLIFCKNGKKRKETKRNGTEWNWTKSIFCTKGTEWIQTERNEFKRNGKEQIETEHNQYFVETEQNEFKRNEMERKGTEHLR